MPGGPLSSNPLSSLGETIQSATIVASGGLGANGVANTTRGTVCVATGGLLVKGARAWVIDAARQINPRAERRRLVLRAESRTATPRFERRRVTPAR